MLIVESITTQLQQITTAQQRIFQGAVSLVHLCCLLHGLQPFPVTGVHEPVWMQTALQLPVARIKSADIDIESYR